MKIKMISLCCLSLFSTAVSASMPPGKDATTHYLKNEQVIDSSALLPSPPEVGSIVFMNDQAMYEKGRLLRNTERGKQAVEDIHLSDGGLASAFSGAFGMPITKKEMPELYKLLKHMIKDTGGLAIRSAKEKYMRIRPFVFYGVPACDGKKNTESKNDSYPSGHASVGWAAALVLTEINPQRQDLILKRGYEFGQSRVICGYHWQSDVDAARIVGSAIVATLHNSPIFLQQLQKAKDEYSDLKKP